MKKILTAIALAALIATPAFAASSHHPAVQSPAQLLQSSPKIFMYAPDATVGISDPARDSALRDCNGMASKFSNQSWQTAQFGAYGTCMTEHGQRP
jgi:hypothetical protein